MLMELFKSKKEKRPKARTLEREEYVFPDNTIRFGVTKRTEETDGRITKQEMMPYQFLNKSRAFLSPGPQENQIRTDDELKEYLVGRLNFYKENLNDPDIVLRVLDVDDREKVTTTRLSGYNGEDASKLSTQVNAEAVK